MLRRQRLREGVPRTRPPAARTWFSQGRALGPTELPAGPGGRGSAASGSWGQPGLSGSGSVAWAGAAGRPPISEASGWTDSPVWQVRTVSDLPRTWRGRLRGELVLPARAWGCLRPGGLDPPSGPTAPDGAWTSAPRGGPRPPLQSDLLRVL